MATISWWKKDGAISATVKTPPITGMGASGGGGSIPRAHSFDTHTTLSPHW
jgi:hypothetical protein